MSDKHNVKSAQAILLARVRDAVNLCDKRHKPQFIGFLDEKEQLYTEKLALQMGFKNYMFWGGHTSSERVVFGAFPDYIEPNVSFFPIRTITAAFRKCDQLSHRDFLGALLSLGMERETLGDFLIEDGRCVFFVREEISQFILMQIKKIGLCPIDNEHVIKNLLLLAGILTQKEFQKQTMKAIKGKLVI